MGRLSVCPPSAPAAIARSRSLAPLSSKPAAGNRGSLTDVRTKVWMLPLDTKFSPAASDRGVSRSQPLKNVERRKITKNEESAFMVIRSEEGDQIKYPTPGKESTGTFLTMRVFSD